MKNRGAKPVRLLKRTLFSKMTDRQLERYRMLCDKHAWDQEGGPQVVLTGRTRAVDTEIEDEVPFRPSWCFLMDSGRAKKCPVLIPIHSGPILTKREYRMWRAASPPVIMNPDDVYVKEVDES